MSKNSIKTLYLLSISLIPKPSEQPRLLRLCPQKAPVLLLCLCQHMWKKERMVDVLGYFLLLWQNIWYSVIYKESREWCWHLVHMFHGGSPPMKRQSHYANFNLYSYNPTNVIVEASPSRCGLVFITSQSLCFPSTFKFRDWCFDAWKLGDNSKSGSRFCSPHKVGREAPCS